MLFKRRMQCLKQQAAGVDKRAKPSQFVQAVTAAVPAEHQKAPMYNILTSGTPADSVWTLAC